MDILCISTTDWDEIWGSRQQVLSRLAKAGHRVLFVERQVGPEHLLRDAGLRARKTARWRLPGRHRIDENLWTWQPPLMLPGRYYSKVLNAAGQLLLRSRLKTVLAEAGFGNPILWLYPPHSAPLIGKFNEIMVVYHCIERFAGGQTGWKRRIMLLQETDLLRKADLVFCHSEGLQQLYQAQCRTEIRFIPSAADVSFFQSTEEVHPAVHHIPRPRIAVAGTFDNRIDTALLMALSSAHPEWSLVLIGQIRPGRVNLKSVLSAPNVHYLGFYPHEELPTLLNGMDALIIPYVRNELTEYINPVKLYEYLAVGKPIISVSLPEVKRLKPWVAIADEHGLFVRAVEESLAHDSVDCQKERRRIAHAHSWDLRVQEIWQFIQDVLKEKQHGAN